MTKDEKGLSEVVTSHPELKFSDLKPVSSSSFANLARGIDLHFTYDGRAALFQLFSHLAAGGRKTVLLPAFHCLTVVEPAVQSGFSPRFYQVKQDLTVDFEDFARCLDTDVAAAVVVNYFGFPANIETTHAACRDNGTPLIEDCAHSFLSAAPVRLAGERGEFAIYSFKKLVPSHIGGAVRSNVRDNRVSAEAIGPPYSDSIVNIKRLLEQAVAQSDSRFLTKMQGAMNSVYHRLKKRGATETSETVEADHPQTTMDDHYPFVRHLAAARMPWYARYILRNANLQRVVAARQQNYETLRESLSSISGIEIAHQGGIDAVCPWALPIKIENRSFYDQQFRSKGVPLFTFGETLHPALESESATSKSALDDARYLSNNMLCISVHQNVPKDTLDGVFDVVSGVMRNS